MKVLITGMDGYIGWPLAMYLARRDFTVLGVDHFARRRWVEEVGGQSALPLADMTRRLELFKARFGRSIEFLEGDLLDAAFLDGCLSRWRPDAIVHLGEQASAPYSMMDLEHASFTQQNNVIGTLNLLFSMTRFCPEAHLVKLGTMGEYGTPNVSIPEGFFTIDRGGRRDTLPFPRQGGSWYHLSKIHDSHNIAFACKVWGLKSTDLMQGPVYGISTEETDADEGLATRFDFDAVFGTIVNRFCAQAVMGYPLTPYGKGSQKRGFIQLSDSLRCIELSLLHPPKKGEYRVFNQFTEIYSVNEIAEIVAMAGRRLGIPVEVRPLDNPRIELEEHFYEAEHEALLKLGLRPHYLPEALPDILQKLRKYRDRLEAKREQIAPKVLWQGEAAGSEQAYPFRKAR